jgi:hypothetical protein
MDSITKRQKELEIERQKADIEASVQENLRRAIETGSNAIAKMRIDNEKAPQCLYNLVTTAAEKLKGRL